MSSSTATISTNNSTMNNNDRKRAISSSICPSSASSSSSSAKRQNLSSNNSRRSTEKIFQRSERNDFNERQSRSTSNSNQTINKEYSPFHKSSIDIKNSKKSDLTIDTKKAKSIPLIVKSSTSNIHSTYDSDEEFEKTNKILKKSTNAVAPSSLMTIVTTSDLSKKSMRTDNVIIQQIDGNLNSNSSTKLVKFVVPQSTNNSSSIKMLSSGDGLASALRVPTKIQLTKPLFVSSTKYDKTSCLFSSNRSINQQDLTNSSSNTLMDIPIDLTDKTVKSIHNYNSSTTLPPTPPPPVIDNTRNLSIQTLNNQRNQQGKLDEISTINMKAIEDIDSSTIGEHSNAQIISKNSSSSLSDWSVPPTSELSPTSLTSSSPDLTQNHLHSDELFYENNSKINFKRSTKRRYRSSSLTMSCLQTNKTFLKPIKSKSLTRLSNTNDFKLMSIQNKRSLLKSPTLKLSTSQHIRKRQRVDRNESTIKNLLNDIVDRISLLNNVKDDELITKENKNISYKEIKTKDKILSRSTSSNRKNDATFQTSDSQITNESRSMIMTQRELDDLAFLLHANAHRAEYEQVDNPTQVEERMREIWSQMSIQKKNIYYKRVIQIYKKPNKNIIIASTSTEDNSSVSNDSTSIEPSSNEIKRQTSTPLSFHSVTSSIIDEQSNVSPQEKNIFNDIVDELIKGAKSLDKLSCSPTDFENSIYEFVQSTCDKQIETIKGLEQQAEKKCSTQLNRATIFWTQKINYFAIKYLINPSSELMNQLTLIVKYFYLRVLSLNCRKQEFEFETALTDLIRGNFSFIDQSFCSTILTNIIEDLILRSSLANDYLASQPLIINDVEYSLPFVRNVELEHELLYKNDIHLTTPPFRDFGDLEDYLKRCENSTLTIPYYPMQQSHHPPMYFPTCHFPHQYYYSHPQSSQSTEMNNYYYNPQIAYPNSHPIYPYSQGTCYYRPTVPYNNNNNNEQFKYYYNPQQASYTYSSQTNSINDIPLSNNHSHHRTYRQMSSTLQRTYSNSQQPATPGTPSTPAVFDATTVVSPQSKSMNTTNNNYPP